MSNKILIILIGVTMVFMLGLGGGLFMMWNKLSAMETHAQGPAEDGKQADRDTPVPVDETVGPNFFAGYIHCESC